MRSQPWGFCGVFHKKNCMWFSGPIRTSIPEYCSPKPCLLGMCLVWIALKWFTNWAADVIVIYLPYFSTDKTKGLKQWHMSGNDHGREGVTATAPEWFVVQSRDVVRANHHATTNHHKHIWLFFGSISYRFKHNHNEPYWHWCQDGGWHALSIVTHVTAWRQDLLLTHPTIRGNHYSFTPKIHVVIV